jgi:hypothetical protein
MGGRILIVKEPASSVLLSSMEISPSLDVAVNAIMG